jgi:cobalt-zinc-cadmium efflux system protein
VGHGHVHSHGRRGEDRKRLAFAFTVAVIVLALQVVGGIVSGSVALLADAAHVAGDAAGVGVALFASAVASRPATIRRTFGWQRAEVLAAAVNAALLLAVTAWVLFAAVSRLREPAEVAATPMLVVAAVGAAANAVSLFVLAGADRTSLNIRGAYLEVLADLLGSVAVVLAAVVIAVTGFDRADAVVAVGIAVAVVPRALHLLRESVDVLLEATPKGVDLVHVREHLLTAPGVRDVHDLHAWTITSGMPVLSAHVVVDDAALSQGNGAVLDRLGQCLVGHFDVEHSTLQLEPVGHQDHEQLNCEPNDSSRVS